jgi:aerobic-type carbon monoxide dehydrogenase small subunit (CoxS/CutS family)
MAKRGQIELRVNGQQYMLEVDPGRLLLEVLREELGLYSVREGCGIGVCGTCTILLDGRPVSSCLMLVGQVHGRAITTVEGLASDGTLHPIQQAFLANFAFQCAYCTPGFLLTAAALRNAGEPLNEETLRVALSGNLCRCGCYLRIWKAVCAALASP